MLQIELKFYQTLKRGLTIAILWVIIGAGKSPTFSEPYWVYFVDKGLSNSTQIDSALVIAKSNLTSRSSKRRSKLNHPFLVDELDIQVYPLYIKELSNKSKSSPRNISRWLNAVSIDISQDRLSEIGALPFVKQIRAVRSFQRSNILIDDAPAPDAFDPIDNYVPRRDPDIDYGTSLRQNSFFNAHELHQRGYLGSGILIGITDSGFDNLGHNCFNQLDIVDAWDFVNDDDDVANGDDRGDGTHGTKTLSIIAGWDPGRLIGISPESSFVLAKTEDTEDERQVEEDNWVAAVEWMDSLGVEIVTSSLSYMDWYDYEDMDGNSAVTSIVADRAVAVGMVIVTAMGNTGRAQFPSSKMGAPADADSVISVGATIRDSSLADFSSQGPTWDGRIKPDFVSYGSGVKFASSRNVNDYGAGSGTSFSTPAIAGLCALLIQADPYLTPIKLRDLLRSSANNREEPDTLMGWGIPDGLVALNNINHQVIDLRIPLRRGWTTISHNFSGNDIFAIVEAFNQIVLHDNLLLVKDERGEFYSPRNGFNGIEFWNSLEGYKVRLVNADSLILRGNLFNTNIPIALTDGWNIVAYKPNYVLSAEVAFNSLVESNSLIIAKGHSGRFYIPRHHFNNMDLLEPGFGYHVKVDGESELIYPRQRIASYEEFGNYISQPDPSFFTMPEPGATCMNLLVYAGNNISNGDEIGFFDVDGLIGAGVVANGVCGVAIWGDQFGVFPNAVVHPISSKNSKVFASQIEWIEGENTFTPDGFGVVTMELSDSAYQTIHKQQNISVSVTPNPFNDAFRLQYNFLPSESISATVFDMNGRRVAYQNSNASDHLGSGALHFSSGSWASGSYLIKVTSGEVTKFIFAHHVK